MKLLLFIIVIILNVSCGTSGDKTGGLVLQQRDLCGGTMPSPSTNKINWVDYYYYESNGTQNIDVDYYVNEVKVTRGYKFNETLSDTIKVGDVSFLIIHSVNTNTIKYEITIGEDKIVQDTYCDIYTN